MRRLFPEPAGQPNNYGNRNHSRTHRRPIKKNKLFFFFVTDEQRYIGKVKTGDGAYAPARQGIFRYLTTVRGRRQPFERQRFLGTPSVDLNGNILTSANGHLFTSNSVNLLTAAGPNFSQIDPGGSAPSTCQIHALPTTTRLATLKRGLRMAADLPRPDDPRDRAPNNDRNITRSASITTSTTSTK